MWHPWIPRQDVSFPGGVQVGACSPGLKRFNTICSSSWRVKYPSPVIPASCACSAAVIFMTTQWQCSYFPASFHQPHPKPSYSSHSSPLQFISSIITSLTISDSYAFSLQTRIPHFLQIPPTRSAGVTSPTLDCLHGLLVLWVPPSRTLDCSAGFSVLVSFCYPFKPGLHYPS